MCICDQLHSLMDRMIHLYSISSHRFSYLTCARVGLYAQSLLLNCSIPYMHYFFFPPQSKLRNTKTQQELLKKKKFKEYF